MQTKTLALFVAASAALANALAPHARAADVNWDNGASDAIWSTTSANWSGAAWNNTAGDGAIFGAAGVGAVSVPGLVNIDSINFQVNGYSLGGAGSLRFVDGTSTQTTGVINVASGVTAQVAVPVESSLGFQKIGPGVLELTGAGSFTGAIPLDGRARTTAGLLIGGSFGTIDGGTLKVGPGVIPASTNVGFGQGYLDIGSSNLTIANLTFTNQNPSKPWNTTLNANNGIVGSGKLRVTGEINVLGQFGDGAGNTIATEVDLGGGTQVVRIGAANILSLNRNLMFTGELSNGSLLKTIGYNPNGVFAGHDGMSLFANNSYTGSTVMNAGANLATGINQTSSIKIAGTGGVAGSQFSLQGANGSAPNATLIQAFAGGTFVMDNNAATGAAGANEPNVPAAQNNNRIRDDAVVELRDGGLTFRGLLNTAASETFGRLDVKGGMNTLTVAATGSLGTANLTAAGNLVLAPRSALQINGGTLLSGATKVFVGGTLPTADSTGILPGVVSTLDFLTYSGTTGMTPFTGYAADFSTAGTNVSIAAATTVASSVNINALRQTGGGNATLTIGAGQTLGVDSGMILNSGFGALVITGGTLDFGAKPGMLFNTGAIIISASVAGTAGLMHARGTGTYSGNMSGLSGSLDVLSGTANINTDTFTGPINVRNATLNLNVNQTGSELGAITLGVPENDENLTAFNPTLNVSGAGANAVFDRDIIVDNGAKTAAGITLRYPLYAGISPLSNTTGSQTFNGNITLNTGVRLQGGGASNTSTGATVFAGRINGPNTFYVANGRAIFSGEYSNDGGFFLGDQGFSMKVSFVGTGVGSGPLTVSGGNSNTVSYADGGLQSGLIRIWNSNLPTAPQLIPLDSSTINNAIELESDVIANVGPGITATWAGPISGAGPLHKSGTGELVLTSTGTTHTGAVVVNAGTLTARRLLRNNTSVAAGAVLEISPGGAVADPAATSVFAENGFSIAGGLTPAGMLDLNKNGAAFEYDQTDPEATIRAQIIAGYAGGAWTGNGITSSDAAADPLGHAVGYANSPDVGSPSSFLGQALNDKAVLVRYTRQGDADLSGTTDIDDFSLMAINFNQPGAWSSGDFNYSGTTDIDDFSILALNFNQAADGGIAGRGVVPEPAAGVLVGLAALTGRRRRTR